eukprot:1712304-Alexandrium_andersonii.AAC.1
MACRCSDAACRLSACVFVGSPLPGAGAGVCVCVCLCVLFAASSLFNSVFGDWLLISELPL